MPGNESRIWIIDLYHLKNVGWVCVCACVSERACVCRNHGRFDEISTHKNEIKICIDLIGNMCVSDNHVLKRTFSYILSREKKLVQIHTS